MLFKLFFTACTFVLPFARAATWEVSVGKGALVFDPPFVQDVQVGDVINFTFNPKKHS
jgi:plastocyanin